MAENTKIEWCDHTFNPWVGCTKITPACDHCYAEGWAKRTGGAHLWQGERRRTSEANWRQPEKWNRQAEGAPVRPRVFCASLADVFDNQVPPEWRADLFDLIRRTADLDWMLLTKRPQNIIKMTRAAGGLPRNVALGATVEDQQRANTNLWPLAEAAYALKPIWTFGSFEPMLGPIDLVSIDIGDGWWDSLQSYIKYPTTTDSITRNEPLRMPGLGLVIVGGESGPGARPLHPDWCRSLRDQCAAAGVPYFFKQWGEWISAEDWLATLYASHARFIGPDGRAILPGTILTEKQVMNLVEASGRKPSDTHILDGRHMIRVGKRAAGRLLDGIEHNTMPEVRLG